MKVGPAVCALALSLAAAPIVAWPARAQPAGPSPKVKMVKGHPDLAGQWGPPPTDADKYPAMQSAMFDRDHAVIGPDPAGERENLAQRNATGKREKEGVGGIYFGLAAGSYDSEIPYKPEYMEQYKKIVADSLKGLDPDPIAACYPYAMPRVMTNGGFPYIVELDGGYLMIIGPKNELRAIYTDGRGHPTLDDLLKETENASAWGPSFEGHSIGHWEGNTLVVDTVDIWPGTYDQTGAFHSDKIHIVERLKVLSHDLIDYEMTVEDPVMLTRPWTIRRQWARRPAKALKSFPYNGCEPATDNFSVKMVNGIQVQGLPGQ